MTFQAKDVKNISMGAATTPEKTPVKKAESAKKTESVASGPVTVAAGSKVYGVITEAVKARRIAGNAKIMVTITDINIGGVITPLTASSINALTKPTGASSAGKVVRGAAIGALVDGSDGAKTGARVGLGVAILRGGNQVVIPAGTLLEFRLSQPLEKK